MSQSCQCFKTSCLPVPDISFILPENTAELARPRKRKVTGIFDDVPEAIEPTPHSSLPAGCSGSLHVQTPPPKKPLLAPTRALVPLLPTTLTATPVLSIPTPPKVPRVQVYEYRRKWVKNEQEGNTKRNRYNRKKGTNCSACGLERLPPEHQGYGGYRWCQNTTDETYSDWRNRMKAQIKKS